MQKLVGEKFRVLLVFFVGYILKKVNHMLSTTV
jgi:hypothetical protein